MKVQTCLLYGIILRHTLYEIYCIITWWLLFNLFQDRQNGFSSYKKWNKAHIILLQNFTVGTSCPTLTPVSVIHTFNAFCYIQCLSSFYACQHTGWTSENQNTCRHTHIHILMNSCCGYFSPYYQKVPLRIKHTNIHVIS